MLPHISHRILRIGIDLRPAQRPRRTKPRRCAFHLGMASGGSDVRCQAAKVRGNSSPPKQFVAVGIHSMTSTWHPHDIHMASIMTLNYETRRNKEDCQRHWCQLHSQFLTQTSYQISTLKSHFQKTGSSQQKSSKLLHVRSFQWLKYPLGYTINKWFCQAP